MGFFFLHQIFSHDSDLLNGVTFTGWVFYVMTYVYVSVCVCVRPHVIADKSSSSSLNQKNNVSAAVRRLRNFPHEPEHSVTFQFVQL